MKRMEWFAEQYEEGLRNKNVLDVGSYNVNGCYRKIFEEKNIKYTGLDMEKGPNVDITPKSTYKWREIDSDSYTAVISGQALEHVEFFWITMEEIVRVTNKMDLYASLHQMGSRNIGIQWIAGGFSQME